MSYIEQRTDEWFQQRLGKVTASRMSDVLARIKSGEAAVRANYKAQLVAERLTGYPQDSYTNAAMKWGTDQEPFARLAYEIEADEFVKECGFIDHPVIAMSGASPDGLVGKDGMVELKCPETKTHLQMLLTGEVSSKWIDQVVWQLACNPDREWNDFVSFDPRLPPELRVFKKRFYRDNDVIKSYETEVKLFLSEVDAMVLKLKNHTAANQPELLKEAA
jgi:putative phage-type endonuclease